MIEAWFDGACWPNPGHGAYGAVIKRDGLIIHSVSEYSGPRVSNNCTEYQGLTSVLKYLLENGIYEATIYGDADMIVKQVNGQWKAGRLTKAEKKGKVPIKPRLYLPYYEEAMVLRRQLPQVQILWIRRDLNTEADALSTKPLRDRGLRENFYEPKLTESARIDQQFEYAISKDEPLLFT